MGIRRFFLCLTLLMAGPAGLMRAVAESAPPSRAIPHLYAIESPGKLSFLFGTRHNRIPITTFPYYVFQAMQSRKTVAKEILSIGQNVTPPPAPSVAQHSSARTRPEYSSETQNAFKVRGLPPGLLHNPWACTLYLTWETSPSPILDEAFEDLARRFGKELVALDEKSDTDKIISDLSLIAESCDLETLTQAYPPNRLVAEHQTGLQAYYSGDLSAVKGCEGHCADRSKKWIPKLEELHRQGGFFALFGIGHFGGEEGVLSLLQEKGHTLTQVKDLSHLNELLAAEKRAQNK